MRTDIVIGLIVGHNIPREWKFHDDCIIANTMDFLLLVLAKGFV